MQSSVTYQEIKLQGKLEGKKEEAFNLLLKIIDRNLGEIEIDLLTEIEKLSLEKMEELAVKMFNFDCLGDLELWLENNS